MTTTQAPSTLSLIRDSIQFTLKNFGTFLKVSLIPLILLVGAEIFSIYEMVALPDYALAFFALAITALIQAFWIPKWIQHCASPHTPVNWLTIDKSNMEFFGFRFLIGCFVLLWGIIFSPVVQVLEFSTMVAAGNWFVHYSIQAIILFLAAALMIVLFARYSFKFVAISLGRKMSLNSAWKNTGPFALQLYILQILSEVKMGYVFSSFEHFFQGYGRIAYQSLLLLVAWFITAICFCGFTRLYQRSVRD